MSFVDKHKIGSRVLTGFYKKSETEGDASRFLSTESGHQEVIDYDDLTVEGVTSLLATLSTSYIVGANQLFVALRFDTLPQGFLMIPPRDEDTTGLSYEEVDSTTVRIYGVLGGDNDFTQAMFIIPHTSTPASIREKLIVLDQGDNTAVELEGEGDGVLFKSPNGSKWLVRVDDSGNLVTESR